MRLMNCSKCGRFVGKDGDPDVVYDYYNGGYEAGYPLCARCLREKELHNKTLDDDAQKAGCTSA